MGVGLAALATPFYACCLEPRWLGIGRHRIRIPLGESGAPLKILHLSDLHASPQVSLDFIQKAVQLGLGLEPDLICLTGDFVTGKLDQFDRYTGILATAAKRAPAFACLGNHDGGLWAGACGGYEDTAAVRGLLKQSGVQLLHNTALSVEARGRKVCLVGLGDMWANECAAREAFATAKPTGAALTVVLSHNPDTKEVLKPYPWHLLLCGHTHGGQFRLPLVGAPFAPVQDPRFVKGVHRWEGRWVHITKGVGNVYGMRFNCRPEITLLTLS